MKVEMGKKYKTECGLRVRIFATDSPLEEFPVAGCYENEEGKWYLHKWTESGESPRWPGGQLVEVHEPKLIPYDYETSHELIGKRVSEKSNLDRWFLFNEATRFGIGHSGSTVLIPYHLFLDEYVFTDTGKPVGREVPVDKQPE